MTNLVKSIFLSIALSSVGAYALPLPNMRHTFRPLPSTFTTDYNFEGIVALSDCSGSFIRLENAKDTDYGLVLTNGHCYEGGFIDPGQTIQNQASARTFDLMDAAGNSNAQLMASTVLYATMTKTDITLYQLTESYAEILQRYGIRPFTLSSQHPTAGQALQVISGFWKRGYSCTIEAFVNELQEGGWTWMDSIRYSRPGCEVIGGTSGSPIVSDGTRTVIGINNTINENGEQCTFDNPCEVDSRGNITEHQGYGYAEETYLLYSCLDPQGAFNLSTPGCLLVH